MTAPTSSLVESTLESLEKNSCSGELVLSYPFLFVSFGDSTPSYVRHVFAFPHMRAPVRLEPEPELQMAPRWRADNRSEWCVFAPNNLFHFWLSSAGKKTTTTVCLLFVHCYASFLSSRFASSPDACSVKLCASNPLSCSTLSALAPPSFSHTLFSWAECLCDVTAPCSHPPFCGSRPIIDRSLPLFEPAFTGNGPCN